MPVDTGLYDLLKVTPTATASELRVAYRAQALRMHPDKGGDPEQFKTMKAAYDVLSDPKRRDIYDQYGPEVVKMMQGNVGSPHDVVKALSRVGRRERACALLVLLSLAGALLSPAILIALRWDTQLSCHWSVVFIPLWLVQAAGLLFLVRCMDVPPPDEQEADWDEEARAMYNLAKAQASFVRLAGGFSISLFMLLQLLVALRLEGAISWSWFYVLLPWPILEVLSLVWRGLGSKAAWATADPKAAAESALSGNGKLPVKYYEFLAERLVWGVVRVLTFVLIAAKADGLIHGSWFTCLIPAMVVGALVVLRAWSRKGAKSREDPESQGAGASMEEGRVPPEDGEATEDDTCSACCSVGFWLVMACAAAGKLDGGSYSAFLVFLPIFIVVGCITCCFACVVIRLSPDVVDSMQEAAEQEERKRVMEAHGAEQGYGSAHHRTGNSAAAVPSIDGQL